MQYRRYGLSDDKTFDGLFFTEKELLLNIVNIRFSKMKGRYVIKGYPQRLGLLLHRPPGTGKTSLIFKALANRTGRSVVNVPLSKISTNTELYDHIFSTKNTILKEKICLVLSNLKTLSLYRKSEKKTSIASFRMNESSITTPRVIVVRGQNRSSRTETMLSEESGQNTHGSLNIM